MWMTGNLLHALVTVGNTAFTKKSKSGRDGSALKSEVCRNAFLSILAVHFTLNSWAAKHKRVI